MSDWADEMAQKIVLGICHAGTAMGAIEDTAKILREAEAKGNLEGELQGYKDGRLARSHFHYLANDGLEGIEIQLKRIAGALEEWVEFNKPVSKELGKTEIGGGVGDVPGLKSS